MRGSAVGEGTAAPATGRTGDAALTALATVVALAVLALASCASQAPKPAGPERAAPRRDKSTAPERLAALPGVDPESEPEARDRLGVEAAREHKQRARETEEAQESGNLAKVLGVVGIADQKTVATACKDVPAVEQNRCPFAVEAPEAVTDRQGGARLRFAADASADVIGNRVRCYIARRGRGAPPGDCPLDVQGVRATLDRDGDRVVLDLVGDAGKADIVRRKAQAFVRGPGSR